MKSNYFIVATVLMFLTISGFAQDKIYLKTGEQVEAKIIEVNINNLKYKKYSNIDGPTFTIEKSDIHMVVYQNGENQIFEESEKENKNIDGFRRHRINIDILAYMYNGPSYISYEQIAKSGKLGYEIPLNVHMNEYGVVGYSTGLNMKYYITGEGKGFYVGPAVALGVFDFYYSDFGAMVGGKLGGQFQLTKTFGLSLSGNMGYIFPFEDPFEGYGDIAYSINFGINFSFGK